MSNLCAGAAEFAIDENLYVTNDMVLNAYGDGITAGQIRFNSATATVGGKAYLTARPLAANATEIILATGGIFGTYSVYDYADLKNVRNDMSLNAAYTQQANIDADAGADFDPIGNSANKFKGKYDGNCNSISNLLINRTAQYVGLFGYIEGAAATISNLNLNNASITGAQVNDVVYVGGVAGYKDSATI